MRFKRENDQIAIKTEYSYVNMTKGGCLAFLGAVIKNLSKKDRPFEEFTSGGNKYTIGKGRGKWTIWLSCYKGDDIIFSRSYFCNKYILKQFVKTMILSGLYNDKKELLDKVLRLIENINA